IQGAGAAGLTPTAGVHVGDTLTATPPTFLEADNVTTLGGSPDITYTWYRSGVAIAGQTADVYTLTGADLGKIITVKATASLPGRLARTSLASPATAAVAIGTIQPGTYHPVVTMPNPANGIVVANFAGTPTVPASGGFTMTYKWYREGVVAPISTAMSYKLVAADTGKSVSVVVTIAKPGFATYTGFAAVQANAIIPAEALVAQVNGANVTTAAFGNTLNAAPPFYYLQEQYPSGTEIDDAFRTLQWYIDGAPIAGETGFYYVVRATDSGHLINVKVTVTSPLHKTLVDPSNVITIS
ncbi:MAG: hypothetical protein JWP32_363, partial [Schumannella sp.]|nr:hypothetical protein [Schumannella sp.]